MTKFSPKGNTVSKSKHQNGSKNIDNNSQETVETVELPKKFLKKLRLKDDQQGGGDLFNTSLPMASGLAALSPGRAYAPANSAALIREMQGYVAAMEAESGLNIGPSPMGTFAPDNRNEPSFEERRQSGRNNPNVQPKSIEYEDGSKEVVLTRNRGNAYMARGQINDQPVEFLLDTGASQVSIPERVARSLGLKPTGHVTQVQTASGVVQAHEVFLDKLSIGPIVLTGVAALINPADRTQTILLGMSALRRLVFIHEDDKVILRQKKK